ncbi:hypothetical protein BDZ94DRAFT_823223 [Collybia nuda]|uniref:Uncharacterized protein n=1 Tax=Collybia nuda TaxID=64659 RepID=A0A9P5Y0P5_9AGAR|nr:hypothetical protein BDZ94DRAFT_823223 [Collybia nuda]
MYIPATCRFVPTLGSEELYGLPNHALTATKSRDHSRDKRATRLSRPGSRLPKPMSDTILPWICPYFIGVTQQHGKFLDKAPVISKGKKVQLVKFLTYGEESQATPIWARISDKSHVIPIQFSKEAMQDYHGSNQIPFTRLKTAIIAIQTFRPAFLYVPLGGKDKTSPERALAIVCLKFHYIGSAGEDIFGSPVPVEKDPDILEWSIGLNKDGGAGKDLRDRKQPEDVAVSKAHQVEVNVTHAPQTVKQIVTVKSPVRKPTPTANSNLMVAYERSWAATRKPQFRQPPAHIAALLEMMPVHGDPEPENKSSEQVVGTPQRQKPVRRLHRQFPPRVERNPPALELWFPAGTLHLYSQIQEPSRITLPHLSLRRQLRRSAPKEITNRFRHHLHH